MTGAVNCPNSVADKVRSVVSHGGRLPKKIIHARRTKKSSAGASPAKMTCRRSRWSIVRAGEREGFFQVFVREDSKHEIGEKQRDACKGRWLRAKQTRNG